MLTSLRKSINQKVPLNRAIISDILLWVALAGLLAYGVYAVAIAIPNRRGQTIKLDFLNANEISRGAPVRLMGTDIGFVDDIRIKRDHVQITVQTDPDAVKIPSGSVFTILFTGLGGAKSIEVNLPSRPMPEMDGKPVYRVQEPISMRDTLNASLDSVQALQKGSENISDFFGKRKPVEELQFNIRQALEMSEVVNRNAISLNEGLGKMRQDINTYTQMGVETLQGFNHGAAIMNESTQPTKIRPKILTANRNIRSFHGAFVTQGKLAVQVPTRISQFNRLNAQVNIRLGTLNQKLLTLPIPRWLDDFEKGQDTFQATLEQMDAIFARERLAGMEQARTNIQNFNRQVIIWDARAGDWVRQGILKPKPQSPPVPTNTKSAQPQREQSIAIADRFGHAMKEPKLAWWHQPPQAGFTASSQSPRPQSSVDPQATPNPSNPFEPVFSLFQPFWEIVAFLFS